MSKRFSLQALLCLVLSASVLVSLHWLTLSKKTAYQAVGIMDPYEMVMSNQQVYEVGFPMKWFTVRMPLVIVSGDGETLSSELIAESDSRYSISVSSYPSACISIIISFMLLAFVAGVFKYALCWLYRLYRPAGL